MPIISVTRLHLRSLRYLPSFAWRTFVINRQVRRIHGFVGGRLGNELPRGFWTITAWDSLEAMRRFRDSGVHRAAMPRLLRWCDEASFVHWEQRDTSLPSPEEAHRRLQAEGRVSKVYRPSAAHAAGRTAGERMPTLGPMLQPR